jgi:hypothetical protein
MLHSLLSRGGVALSVQLTRRAIMKINWRFAQAAFLLAAAIALQLGAAPRQPSSQSAPPEIFAQTLAKNTLAKHSDITGVEISAEVGGVCKTIASTDTKEIGEKCDADEFQPLHTGKEYVEREKDGFDVSVPMRDSKGSVIAVVGMDIKPVRGQTKAQALKLARQIVQEMQSQVPEKGKLFEKS